MTKRITYLMVFMMMLLAVAANADTGKLIALGSVDWLLIVIYFVAIIGIGFYLKRFADRKEDFFEAGRRNNSWVAGLAFVSANLGALEILGWTGGTVKYGMFVSHFYWIGAVPAMLFLGLYMMPFYYSSKIHSVPGYLKLRFDEKTRLLNAGAFAIMTVLMSGINLYLMALVFRTILGWNWDMSIWVSAAAVACYITMGGLLSAIFTEIVQFFLIWFGLFLISVLGIIDLGGLQHVFNGLPQQMSGLWSTSTNPANNAMGVTWFSLAMGLGWVLSFGYWTTDFLLVQRAFSARDIHAARMTPILASFFKMMLPFIVVIAGLVAYQLIQKGLLPKEVLQNTDSALPYLIARYYPPGLVGLGITALLAGFMAGQAGNVSAFNTVWTYDIYQSVFKKNASNEHLVMVGRITTVVGIFISVLAAYAAKQFPTIMDYIQAIFSWVNAPLFATMLLGMFWKRTTSAGAFWGLVCGMCTSFGIFIAFKFGLVSTHLAQLITFSNSAPSDMGRNLWQAIWAWVVCFVLTVVISVVTKPKTAEELTGLVKAFTPKIDLGQVPFIKRPLFWAIISFICCLALNIYFW
jgi:solute:Na+ symporter, SSS family